MTKNPILALTVILATSGAFGWSAAAPVKHPRQIDTPRATSPEKAAPPTTASLTKGECKALGGTVRDMPLCNSGQACGTRDQNGKQHAVCLEVKN